MSKFVYRCSDCQTEYPGEGIHYLCPSCALKNIPALPPGGVLNVVYDYPLLIKNLKNGFQSLEVQNFIPLLPIEKKESLGYLHVGNTPLYRFDNFQGKALNHELLLKDDSQNPTFSFKDRASIMVSAWARENKISTIVAASTGNAGSSIAGICASQGQKAVVFVPAAAPVAKLTQIMMYGATIVPITSNYDTAFDLSIQATLHFGWYNRNTAFNPLTIEGKKTVAFELYKQCGYQAPDRIFVPVGDGVIISGVYKGFEDLLMLGIISKMPVIVAVQAEQSRNLAHNLYRENFEVIPSTTLADSISVDIPRNYYMAAGYLKKYEGETMTITEDEILDASVKLSRNTGIFSEPAASTAFAGYLKRQPELRTGTKNVVLLTGSGLKDLKSVGRRVQMPDAVEPDMENIIMRLT